MATTDQTWMDFDQIRHSIKNNTVDRLKQILMGFNEECNTHFAKSGKKQEIIERITGALDNWRASHAEDKWLKGKQVIQQVRANGIFTPARAMPLAAAIPSSSTSSHAIHDPPKPIHFHAGHPGSSSIAHYDPYAPPRLPSAVSAPVASSSQKTTGIRFKDSPFFTVDQAVTAIVECPESSSPTDRRSQALQFALNNEQQTKMRAPGSKYQLRLFCTSSIFYAGVSSFRSTSVPCPMEFPPTCEVRVNGTQITANLKGLKKKPGTAPPPDIGKYARITGSNKLEMVYVNSQQPVQSKYYMIVMLVEVTTIDALVQSLKTNHLRSPQEIRLKMKQAMSEDDEIVAGPQKMSLKCPLTFVRIGTPCRSSKCVHPQCFDATSWYTMMEQTTTWLCPVCERTLDHRDLILDGYFDDILQQTPESVEDVMVEADGQWHTSDNKHGSPEWLAVHPPKAKPPPPVKKQSTTPDLNTACVSQNVDGANGYAPLVNGNGKARAPEAFYISDDSDDEEGQVIGALAYPSSASQSFDSRPPPETQTQQSQSQSNNVIDLTLDSDDDDQPSVASVPSNTSGKRKASEYDDSNVADQLWKKGRLDSSRILPIPRVPSSGNLNGAGPVHHPSAISARHPATPPPQPRFTSSFANNILPPPNVNYPRHGSTNPSSLRLPPLNPHNGPNYSASQPQNTRWP